MLPTFTPSDCIKAARSSAGQNCVRVGRKNGWTVIWDDKLAGTATAQDQPLPPDQILTFTDEQFDAFQTALRAGNPENQCLVIRPNSHGGYIFRAASRVVQAAEGVALYFDNDEFDAFVDGVCRREFDLDRFLTAA
ncbi:hypothetical protein [Nocardia gipuzkoensis]